MYYHRTIKELSDFFAKKGAYLWAGFVLGLSAPYGVDIMETTLEDLDIQAEEEHDMNICNFCHTIALIAEKLGD